MTDASEAQDTPGIQVVVLGAGALGCVYGVALADAGCRVTLQAHPANAAAINRDGLLLSTSRDERVVEIPAVSDPWSLPARIDLLVVSAHPHDVDALVEALPSSVRMALSLQSGVGKDAALLRRFGPGPAVGCVTTEGAVLEGPGRVTRTHEGVTYLGDLGSPGPVDEVAALLEKGGLAVEVRDDIVGVNWSRAVMALAAGGVVGLTRLAYHHVFLDDGAAGVFLDLVKEAAAVATAEGVTLVDLPGALRVAHLAATPTEKARAELRRVGEAMVAAGQTHVRLPIVEAIEAGHHLEVAAVYGDVLHLADRHGIDAPVLRTVTRALGAVEAAAPVRD